MKFVNIITRVLFVNATCIIGAVMAVVCGVSLLCFLFFESLQLSTEPFIGVLGLLFLPGFTSIGLITWALGLIHHNRVIAEKTSPRCKVLNAEQWKRFVFSLGDERGLVVLFSILSFVVACVGVALISSIRLGVYMETPEFCGQTCHTAMNPEWVAYKQTAHKDIACIKCHVGATLEGMAIAKLRGTKQLFDVLVDNVPKPVHTPVYTMPSVSETCIPCHITDDAYLPRTIIKPSFLRDEENTELENIVEININGKLQESINGVHWHNNKNVKVEFKSKDDKRKEIYLVRVNDENGEERIYKRNDLKEAKTEWETRTMDCYDCHNRTGHEFDIDEDIVDKELASKVLDKTIPHIKERVVKALREKYSSAKDMEINATEKFLAFYKHRYPRIYNKKKPQLLKTAEVINKMYAKNVHSNMNVSWGTYPSLIGHTSSTDACFRCHNQKLRLSSINGKPVFGDEKINISQDCSLCHKTIAYEEK